VSLDFPCTARVFFPECSSSHCQCLRCTFSEIFTKFDALPLFFCHEIASGQTHDCKQKDVKLSTSTQLREILYTDSQDMLVLSSTVVSRYYNCCADGSISPGNYGYLLFAVIADILYVRNRFFNYNILLLACSFRDQLEMFQCDPHLWSRNWI
jgi:hypothetical protein